MSEAELQPDHLHSTCPEKAAGLQPPSSASAAAPTHLAWRAASLTTKCLQWPLHALTGICDGHALCQNYPFFSHFSSQVLMHFCIWRSLQVGGCVCLGASRFSSLKSWLSHAGSYSSSIGEAKTDWHHCELLVVSCIPLTYWGSSAMSSTILFTCIPSAVSDALIRVFNWFLLLRHPVNWNTAQCKV